MNETDDGRGFLRVLYSLDKFTRDYYGYPRWLPELYLGYGSPVLSFYSPGLFILTHLFSTVIIHDHILTTKIILLFIICNSAIGAYKLSDLIVQGATKISQRAIIDTRLLSVFMYIIVPYPFIINIFLRGDIPEAFALSILPWLWITCRNSITKQFTIKRVVTLSLLCAAIIISHQISSILILVHLGIISLFLVAGSILQFIRPIIIIVSIISGISSVFVIPLVLHADSVRIHVLSHDLYDILHRLSNIITPVNYTWPFEYNWQSLTQRSQSGPLLPSISQTALLLVSASLIFYQKFIRKNYISSREILGILFSILILWLMNLNFSRSLWFYIDIIRFLQYPWRFIGPLSLSISIIGSITISRVQYPIRILLIISFAILTYIETFDGFPLANVTGLGKGFDAATMVAEDYAYDRWGASVASGDGEFTPRSVDIRRPDGSLGGPVRLDRLAPPGAWVGGLAMVSSGEGHVASLHGDAMRLRAVVEVGEAGATLAIHQLDFPGWRATVDGVRVGVQAAPLVPGSGVAPGWVTVAVPPGRHEVAVWFGATWPRLVGDAITCVTLAVLGVVLGREWRRGGSRPVGVTVVVGALLGLATWNLAAEAWTVRAPPAASAATERVVLDVVEAVRRGDVSLGSPSGSRLGPDAFLDAGWLDVRPPLGRPVQVGTRRRWLYMHAPSRVTVRLRVPAGGATFQSGLGLRPDAWEVPVGDGVHFVAEVEPLDGNGGIRTLWFQRVNPRANLDERRWVEMRGDLGEWAGREVDLTLRTEPVDSVAYDWAGWGNPLVVVPSGILRPANGPQPPASIIAPRTWMVDQ